MIVPAVLPLHANISLNTANNRTLPRTLAALFMERDGRQLFPYAPRTQLVSCFHTLQRDSWARSCHDVSPQK